MTDPQNPAAPEPPQQPASQPTAPQPPAADAPSGTGPSDYPPPAPRPEYGAAPPSYPAASPAYGSAPPAAYGAPADGPVPGKTLGIVAFVLSFFVQLVALILGIVALVQSRKAGVKNGWAVAAIIISAVLMLLGIILFFAIVLPLLTFSGEVLQACQEAGFTGTVEVRGLPVDCATVSN
ncbi:DUF4190 domain-containing protein [Microbacterium sp. Leaf288]|uniref:DUF4190 domain-containing protein n=1 Tax=Microbacterium sp. Leaf288 TaxID=1736323 RepID=UPI000A8E6F49|nr:DUF4190 domain-containing protein [Microbacterium sp. Leaf288]